MAGALSPALGSCFERSEASLNFRTRHRSPPLVYVVATEWVTRLERDCPKLHVELIRACRNPDWLQRV
jgi:hypothetical protein